MPTLDDTTLQLIKKYNTLKQQYRVHTIIMKSIAKIDLKNLPTEIDRLKMPTEIDRLKIQRMLKLLRIKDYIKLDNKTSHINNLGNK